MTTGGPLVGFCRRCGDSCLSYDAEEKRCGNCGAAVEFKPLETWAEFAKVIEGACGGDAKLAFKLAKLQPGSRPKPTPPEELWYLTIKAMTGGAGRDGKASQRRARRSTASSTRGRGSR